MWYTVSAIAAGGLAGLFLLSFFVPRAGAAAAYTGIVASLAFTAYATLTIDGGKLWNLGRFNFPLHNYMIGVIGHIVLLTVGCAAAIAFPDRDPGRRRLTYWGFRGLETGEGKVSAATQAFPSK
jgi:solute:Na+ symporter, SSS family